MDGPTSIPLPMANCDQNNYTSSEGTEYMEDSIDATQPRVACWINEEGRNEMDLT